MTALRYPSTELPAPASFELDLPDGWIAHPAPGLAFVAAPGGDGPPTTSLVGSVRRIDGAVTLTELADSIGDEIARVDAISLVDRTEREIHGEKCLVITFEVGAGADAVRQSKALWLVDVGSGLSDAVTVTASYPAGADDTVLDDLGSIIDSVRITTAGTRPHSDPA